MHLLSKSNIFFCFLVGHFMTVTAQGLDERVRSLSEHQDIASGILAISVVDVASGSTIYSHNGNKYITPASIQKLITTAAVLDKLGPSFQYQTNVLLNGNQQENTFKGDLIIKGSGDPSFCSPRFGSQYDIVPVLKQLTTKLKDKGISSISGNVVVDASVFNSNIAARKWLFEDIGNYYGAGAAGFNFLENRYEIDFRSGSTGAQTSINKVLPEAISIHLHNEVKAGPNGSRDNAYVFGIPHNNHCYVRGTIPPNQSSFMVKGAMPDPALTFAQILKDHLQNSGISVSGASFSNYDINEACNQGDVLHTYSSPRLGDIVYWTNFKSINLFAEALLKSVSPSNSSDKMEDGIEVIKNWLSNYNVDSDKFKIYDGSGLSPSNKITADQFASFLANITRSAHFPVLEESLSIAGHSEKNGYLRNMLAGTAAANNLTAKSGYMDEVRSYAGYVTDRSNRKLAYVIAVNGYDCSASEMRQMMEPVMEAIALLSR